jgi:ribonuclease HI
MTGKCPSCGEKPTKITVHYDGACEPRNPKGVATYGFVVYEDGAKIGEGRGLAAEPWSDGASNNVAEYTAMISAFKWLIEHGYAKADVLVKGDSQLSIRQMQGSYGVWAPRIIPLHMEAKKLASTFRRVRYLWVPRENNMEADLLSELALRDYWREYRAAKASEIRPEDVVHLSGSKFRVRGYGVDLEAYTCECPDYRRTNSNPRLRIKLPCKHILAAEKLC